MIKSISGQIKAKAALIDPDRYGRSDTSPLGRWFWEIDKVLLLLISVLIAIGLIAVAAASPAAVTANTQLAIPNKQACRMHQSGARRNGAANGALRCAGESWLRSSRLWSASMLRAGRASCRR